MLESAIAHLVAEAACRRLCHLYCRGLDRADETLLRSLFHPDSTHRHADFEGASTDFCAYAITVVSGFAATQHLLGNVAIELAETVDVAHGESYFVAYHRAPAGSVGPFPAHDPAYDEDVFVGGRYLDRFERRDGVWRIARRHGVHDWERWARADDRQLAGLRPGGRGTRDASDPLYGFLDGRGA